MPSSWVLSLLSYLKEDQAKYKENVIALTNIHKEVLFNPLQNSNKSSIVQTSAYQNASEYVFFICLFVQKYTGRFAGFFKCFRKTSNQIRICRVRYILTLWFFWVFFEKVFFCCQGFADLIVQPFYTFLIATSKKYFCFFF